MKLLDHIEARIMDVRPDPARFASIAVSVDKEPERGPVEMGRHTRWRVETRVGCIVAGGDKIDGDISRRVRELMAREVFGELEDDLYALLRHLSGEFYRPNDDPAIVAVNTMLRKVRGQSN